MTFDQTRIYRTMEIVAHALPMGFNDAMLHSGRRAQLVELFKAWAIEDARLMAAMAERDARRVA